MTDPLQPDPILQSHLREAPWHSPATARLPGTGPLDPGDWLRTDDAFAPQLALRERLIAARLDRVHALMPEAEAPARELLSLVTHNLNAHPAFSVTDARVTRPDGETRDADPAKPLLSLGHLVQQDFCILQRQGEEHVLTGAILCFPASWTLDEKIGRPLTAIHDTVTPYTGNIARRVQRMFDVVHPDRPLWRVNLLEYADFRLYQPRRAGDPRPKPEGIACFLRSERQCISRLPESGAIVFSIHTTVVQRQTMPPGEKAALISYLMENSHGIA